MSNGKVMIIHLIIGFIKKTLLHKMSYFPELHDHTKKQTKFELDLSSYATRSDLKNPTGVET